MSYTFDKYGECVLHTTETAAQVVADLFSRGHVVTTWTDQDGSKFDLLWSWDATRIGRSSMVDAGPAKLFVGVVGCGCFGFTTGYGFLSPSYVQEKLKVSGGVTGERLASFISAVRGGLADELRHTGAPHPGIWDTVPDEVAADLALGEIGAAAGRAVLESTPDNSFPFYRPDSD